MNIHDIYRPFQRYFRAKRMALFARLFGLSHTDRVIDVGGYEFNWTLIDAEPNVLLVNLEDEERQNGRFRKIKGDGRQLTFHGNSFDIAYSNSVIEHVGGWDDQVAFAREIRRVAPRYYVQTPNRWFFVEPHLISPVIHFLPEAIMRKLVRYFSVWGLVTRPDQQKIDAVLASIRLLDRKQMRKLFPDADILVERFFGMPKSLIAVRR